MFLLNDICWYGWLWLGFIAIAFCSARFAGCFGILLGVGLIAIILCVLDIRWIYDEMQNHPGNGRDADGIFILGLLLRIVIINLLLLPVRLLGLRLFRRRVVKPVGTDA